LSGLATPCELATESRRARPRRVGGRSNFTDDPPRASLGIATQIFDSSEPLPVKPRRHVVLRIRTGHCRQPQSSSRASGRRAAPHGCLARPRAADPLCCLVSRSRVGHVRSVAASVVDIIVSSSPTTNDCDPKCRHRVPGSGAGALSAPRPPRRFSRPGFPLAHGPNDPGPRCPAMCFFSATPTATQRQLAARLRPSRRARSSPEAPPNASARRSLQRPINGPRFDSLAGNALAGPLEADQLGDDPCPPQPAVHVDVVWPAPIATAAIYSPS